MSPRTSVLHPPPPAHFLVAHCRCCTQPTDLEVLTIATFACSMVAGCRSICVPTTIYCRSKERWSVLVAEVITTGYTTGQIPENYVTFASIKCLA